MLQPIMRTVSLMIKAGFATSLKRRRGQKKMTQEQLALASGLSLRFVQDLEAGRKGPSLGTLFRLAGALGTTPQTLLGPVWRDWRSTAK